MSVINSINLRKIIMLSAIPFLLTISSCYSVSNNTINYKKEPWLIIKNGDTKEDIMNLMGKPWNRNFMYDHEEWQYKVSGGLVNSDRLVQIQFLNDKVVGMSSHDHVFPTKNEQKAEIPSKTYYNHAGRHKVMSDEEFNAFCKDYEKAPFMTDKTVKLKYMVKITNFTCRQCSALMSLTPFDNDRVEVFEIIQPVIVDKENYKEILSSVSFTNNKDKLRKSFGWE